MSDTSFDDRIRRIQQGRNAAPTRHSSASEQEASLAATSPGSHRRFGSALSFSLGVLWLFTTMKLSSGLPFIQGIALASETLRPHEDKIMLACVVLIGVSMVAFAWTIHRTAFRSHRRNAGWALSLGAVSGFILGVGPLTFLAMALEKVGI